MIDLIRALLHSHHEGLRAHFDQALNELKQELKIMSGSLSEQLAAAQADTNARLDGIGTDVTEIGSDVDRLLTGLTPGDAVTQAMVDAANSIRDRVGAVKDGLDAINAKVPPAPAA